MNLPITTEESYRANVLTYGEICHRIRKQNQYHKDQKEDLRQYIRTVGAQTTNVSGG